MGAKPPATEGWGSGGKASSRCRHGGSEPPALKNFVFFKLNFRSILIKLMLFKVAYKLAVQKYDYTKFINGLCDMSPLIKFQVSYLQAGKL